jgi:hypothetical protein
MVKNFSVIAGSGKYTVSITAGLTGNGIILQLLGGEKPHVGAVVISLPRPSLRDPAQISCNSIVVPILGHKDDELAKPVAERVACLSGQSTVVIAGVHTDNATTSAICLLKENTSAALDKLCSLLSDIISQ